MHFISLGTVGVGIVGWDAVAFPVLRELCVITCSQFS